MIIINDNAAKKVKELISKQDNLNLKLRIFVQGGGCSGFSYGFTFDEELSDDDSIIEKDGIVFLLDSASIQYLDGSTIDYEETLQSSQFVIRNPNAVSKCGCGSSFSV